MDPCQLPLTYGAGDPSAVDDKSVSCIWITKVEWSDELAMKAVVVSDMLPERCPLGLYVGVVYFNREKTTKAHQILSSIGSSHKEVHISGLTNRITSRI